MHVFNDWLNRRLTVRIGYKADDYRGHAVSMEFHVDEEERCVVTYPVRRSNLVGDTFCDVFGFLDRCDIDGCQLKHDYPTCGVIVEATDYSKSSQRPFHFSNHKSPQVAKNHDYVFLLANAYVFDLHIYTLQCQPTKMACAWTKSIESSNGSCVIERLCVKMVSAADWREFLTTALDKATVREFELNDAHYHTSGAPWRRPWLPASAANFLQDRCFRFGKSVFHPLLLRVADLTVDKSSPWKTRCEVSTSSGLSSANLLRLIMDGVPGRRRLVVHCTWGWDFASIFSTIIQAFPKLRTGNTLPLRTELHTRYWLSDMLPSEWPKDEPETLHVINDFTRQRLTIAVPWRINPLHPVIKENSKRALILLEDLTKAE